MFDYIIFVKIIYIVLVLLALVLIVSYRNHKSLMIAIALYFFMPKTHFIAFMGVPYFNLILIFLSLSLLLAVSNTKIRVPKSDFLFISLAFLAFFIQYSVGTLYNIASYAYLDGKQYIQFVSYMSIDFFGLVFLLASFKFISKQDQLVKIFKLILVLALVLALEFYYSIIFGPLVLGKYAFDSVHVFKSLLLSSDMMVALWASVSVIICSYFYIKEKKFSYLVMIPFLLYIPLYNGARSCYVPAILCSILVLMTPGKVNYKRILLVLYLPLVCFTLVYFAMFHSGLSTKRTADKLHQAGSSASSWVRVGQSIRAVQFIFHNAPFGAGQSMGRYLFHLDSVEKLSSDDLIFTWLPQAYSGYARITYDGVQTDAQIGVVSFIMSYGLLGALALLSFVFNISKWSAFSSCNRDSQNKSMTVFLRAMFLFYFIYFIFNTNPFLYIVLFTCYRGMSLSKQHASEPFAKQFPVTIT